MWGVFDAHPQEGVVVGSKTTPNCLRTFSIANCRKSIFLSFFLYTKQTYTTPKPHPPFRGGQYKSRSANWTGHFILRLLYWCNFHNRYSPIIQILCQEIYLWISTSFYILFWHRKCSCPFPHFPLYRVVCPDSLVVRVCRLVGRLYPATRPFTLALS